jgi:hypothetical protein
VGGRPGNMVIRLIQAAVVDAVLTVIITSLADIKR